MGLQPEPTSPPPRWGLAGKVLFRFALAYQVLYILPFPLNVLPTLVPVPAVMNYVSLWGLKPYRDLWDAVVLWVGKHVFGVEITYRPAGSGDTTWNHVQLFCFAALAAAVAGLWSLLDRRRAHYDRLHEGLRVYVRFYIATTLISYGAVKVIKTQFPAPSAEWLLVPYGESSPMRLLWTFMGASEPYTVLAGAAEMAGGLLLCTRRTTLLGALVSFGVMFHVAALNYCYDVPVKLFSTHLALMAVFLTLPDLPWMTRAFLLGRPAQPRPVTPLTRRKWLGRALLALRTAAVLAYIGFSLNRAYDNRTAYGDLASRPPLHGLWEVEEFEADGKARPPLTTDAVRWQRAVFAGGGPFGRRFVIHTMTGSRSYYGVEVEPERQTITLSRPGGPPGGGQPPVKFELTYRQPEPGLLVLEGTLEKWPLRTRLRHVDESQFLLVNRGFHWINETPYNVAQPRTVAPAETGRRP
jgi:hypothetical protein